MNRIVVKLERIYENGGGDSYSEINEGYDRFNLRKAVVEIKCVESFRRACGHALKVEALRAVQTADRSGEGADIGAGDRLKSWR